jgi:hypothetical protein
MLSRYCYYCDVDYGFCIVMAIIDSKNHTVCEQCLMTKNLKCMTPGCLSPVFLTIFESHALTIQKSTLIKKCKQCSNRPWFDCSRCGESKTSITSYDGRSKFVNNWNLIAPKSVAGTCMYEVWASGAKVHLCGKCILGNQCQRCCRVDSNVTSVCNVFDHRYCKMCIAKLPSISPETPAVGICRH